MTSASNLFKSKYTSRLTQFKLNQGLKNTKSCCLLSVLAGILSPTVTKGNFGLDVRFRSHLWSSVGLWRDCASETPVMQSLVHSCVYKGKKQCESPASWHMWVPGAQGLQECNLPSFLTATSTSSPLRDVHSRLHKTKIPGIKRSMRLSSENIFSTITAEQDVDHINSRKNQTFAFIYTAFQMLKSNLNQLTASVSLFSLAVLMAGDKCMWTCYICTPATHWPLFLLPLWSCGPKFTL